MAMITPSILVRDLNGHRTELLAQSFADRIMIIVTQLGKVGNLVQATIPDTAPLIPQDAQSSGLENSLPNPSPAIQLTPLLGSPATEHLRVLQSLYAAQIATIVWLSDATGPLEGSRRPVIIGLALKKTGNNAELNEQERETFLGVMDMLRQVLQQK